MYLDFIEHLYHLLYVFSYFLHTGDLHADYTLHSVHMVIRHGDRSPMYKLPNQKSPRVSCLLEEYTNVSSYDTLVTSFIDKMARVGHQIEHGKLYGLYPHQATCLGAQLTGKGALQHLLNGAELRKLYVDRQGLFPQNPRPDEILIKTTDYSRTYQSAVALIFGLLPDLETLKISVSDNLEFCDERRSGVSCSCPQINRLRQFAKREEIKMKSGVTATLLSSIRDELGHIYGLDVKRVPWIGRVVDVVMGYICHHLPLPCSPTNKQQINEDTECINNSLINKMWQYLDKRGEILLSGHADYKYSLLISNPILREIAHSMLNTTNNLTKIKFTLYSGHDSTMTPLAKALGIHDGHWPPFGSRLTFELYSNSNTQYFIKIIYNGVDKTKYVGFCDKSSLCPLRIFVDFAFESVFRTFGKQNYTTICTGK